jgi:hypothetical protein
MHQQGCAHQCPAGHCVCVIPSSPAVAGGIVQTHGRMPGPWLQPPAAGQGQHQHKGSPSPAPSPLPRTAGCGPLPASHHSQDAGAGSSGCAAATCSWLLGAAGERCCCRHPGATGLLLRAHAAGRWKPPAPLLLWEGSRTGGELYSPAPPERPPARPPLLQPRWPMGGPRCKCAH